MIENYGYDKEFTAIVLGIHTLTLQPTLTSDEDEYTSLKS